MWLRRELLEVKTHNYSMFAFIKDDKENINCNVHTMQGGLLGMRMFEVRTWVCIY